MICFRNSVSPDDAAEAAKKLNRKEFFGNTVKVEVAKPKKRGKTFSYSII
jgi:RNA recognition motif-containing protein